MRTGIRSVLLVAVFSVVAVMPTSNIHAQTLLKRTSAAFSDQPASAKSECGPSASNFLADNGNKPDNPARSNGINTGAEAVRKSNGQKSESAGDISGSANNTGEPPLADDRLTVMLQPGADMTKVRLIIKEAHATITNELHVNSENYSLLIVKPETGKAEETMRMLNERKGNIIRSVGRNYVAKPGEHP